MLSRILQNAQENTCSGLKPTTLLKKRLQHRFFPVNFAKLLEIPFVTEYLQWEFAKLRVFRAFVPYVPSHLTPPRFRALRAFVPSRFMCLHALSAFSRYVPWFLRALITHPARLICYLRALLIRDIKSLIKGNFKMFQKET